MTSEAMGCQSTVSEANYKSMDPTVKVRRLNTSDLLLFQKLIQIFHEVFEMGENPLPDESYLSELLEKGNFIVFVVTTGDELAGGLTAFELPSYYTMSSELFIYDIGIAPIHQRKGFGQLLISALQDLAAESGISEIFVAANEDDRHALDFYHTAGGKAEKVFHFSFPAKNNRLTINPG